MDRNGIIVGHDCIIGKNVRIHQQVTIAAGNVVIGDNVLIGAVRKKSFQMLPSEIT